MLYSFQNAALRWVLMHHCRRPSEPPQLIDLRMFKMLNRKQKNGKKKDGDTRCVQLQRRLLAARMRWEREVIANAFASRTAPGHGRRGTEKVLYLVCGGGWLDTIEREICQFRTRLDECGLTGRKGMRLLWLPTIIYRPQKITLKKYAATSTRAVSLASARAFAKKGVPLNTADQVFVEASTRSFVVRSRTGTTYRLKVRHRGGKVDYVGFTSWAVCVCRSKERLPKLRKSKDPRDVDFDGYIGAVYRHGNATLYSVEEKQIA